jgi:hypothetical protein
MITPIGAGLGDEDFDFTAVKVEWENAAFDGDAVGGVENVTNYLSLWEAGVGDISVDLTVDLIGNTDEELSTSKCVDVLIGPLLGEDVVLDAL